MMGHSHTVGDDTPRSDRISRIRPSSSLFASYHAKRAQFHLLSKALDVIVCCLIIVAGGCGMHSQKQHTQVVYVDINEMVTLHPSWANIVQMNRILATEPSRKTLIGAQPLRIATRFKASQPLKDEISASDKNPRKSDVLQPAFNRIESMRTRIDMQNSKILDQWSKTESQKALGKIALEMNKLDTFQNGDTSLVKQSYQSKIRVYQLRAIGYESYIRTYTGPLQDNARLKLADANRNIAELVKEMNAKLTEIKAKYAHTLQLYKDQVYKEMNDNIKQREEKLRMETDNRLNRYKQEIQDNLNALSGDGQSESADISVPELKASFPLSKLPHFHVAPSISSFNTYQNELGAIRSQRDRLLQTIRSDIMDRINQIALRRNWTVSYKWRRGETDETQLFKQLLTQEFEAMTTNKEIDLK